jgi:hypothetical protein
MMKYECLHHYSQHGWEHWTDAVTSFFFRRTQRGGFFSDIDDKTKLVPIARWCQRQMMHVSGTTEKIFNGEIMLEVEKEIEVKWTEWDEARYTAKLILRKIRDETTEHEREKVAAMAVEQRDRVQKSRDKVRLVAEEAMAVVTARAASSMNRSGLTHVQRLHIQQDMARREVQIAEETRQTQSQRDVRRKTLVKEQAARKADRETSRITKRKKNWQNYFCGDGVVMDSNIHDAILGESLQYMED